MLEQMMKYLSNRIEDDDPCLGEIQEFPPEVQAIIRQYTEKFEGITEQVKNLYGTIFALKKEMHQAMEVHMPALRKENYKIAPDGKSYRILHDEPQNQPAKPKQPPWAAQMIKDWEKGEGK